VQSSLFWIVDAFVGTLGPRELRGNPAAVVVLREFPPAAQLQEWANEFNLSETAFVVPLGDGSFDLRWMTPQVEVDLCGHATLAATAALLDAGQLAVGETARFHTRSGELKSLAGRNNRPALDFPIQTVEECAMPAELRAALRMNDAHPWFCGRASDDWLVGVTPRELAEASPDFAALAKFEARGVILTALPEGKAEAADFYSRFFAPRIGIGEDPVTGSAHTKLASFWAARLGKTKMNAVQLSKRGGRLQLELRGERVAMAGKCRIRAHGQLR